MTVTQDLWFDALPDELMENILKHLIINARPASFQSALRDLDVRVSHLIRFGHLNRRLRRIVYNGRVWHADYLAAICRYHRRLDDVFLSILLRLDLHNVIFTYPGFKFPWNVPIMSAASDVDRFFELVGPFVRQLDMLTADTAGKCLQPGISRDSGLALGPIVQHCPSITNLAFTLTRFPCDNLNGVSSFPLTHLSLELFGIDVSNVIGLIARSWKGLQWLHFVIGKSWYLSEDDHPEEWDYSFSALPLLGLPLLNMLLIKATDELHVQVSCVNALMTHRTLTSVTIKNCILEPPVLEIYDNPLLEHILIDHCDGVKAFHVGNCRKLESLRLTVDRIESVVVSVGDCPTLGDFLISGPGQCFVSFDDCPLLAEAQLERCSVPTENITQLHSLRWLDLITPNINAEELFLGLSSLPVLHSVLINVLDSCTGASAELRSASLKYFDIKGKSFPANLTLLCPSLVNLEISNYDYLNTSESAAPEVTQKVSCLDISACSELSILTLSPSCMELIALKW
eukprot:CAMPEP_0184658118 /NCGR_PEP_ID=MMETSP0308-20130426/23592_1 /TAXON_ID=38269 /ORGANISM="Gloeochaete witrockiana, Strain SAG 46.84" /LENGTH=513 /DNA_ID=CAMNT_0027096765 /DNA_START=1 /DNA_END=1539 /DNA_ORIENTATION=+